MRQHQEAYGKVKGREQVHVEQVDLELFRKLTYSHTLLARGGNLVSFKRLASCCYCMRVDVRSDVRWALEVQG